MKKATLFALKHDREALLLSLQKCGEWMTINPENADHSRSEQTAQSASKTQAAIKFLQSHDKSKKPMIAQREKIEYSAFMAEKKEADELNAKVDEIAQQINNSKSDIATAKATIEQLAPWQKNGSAVECRADAMRKVLRRVHRRR